MASNFAGRSVRVTLKNREQLQGTVQSATGGLLTLTNGEFRLKDGFYLFLDCGRRYMVYSWPAKLKEWLQKNTEIWGFRFILRSANASSQLELGKAPSLASGSRG
jgi:hypothetical protein